MHSWYQRIFTASLNTLIHLVMRFHWSRFVEWHMLDLHAPKDSSDALLAACAVTAAEPSHKCCCWAADAIHYAARVLVSRAVNENTAVPAAHTLLESEAANDDEKVVAAFAHLYGAIRPAIHAWCGG